MKKELFQFMFRAFALMFITYFAYLCTKAGNQFLDESVFSAFGIWMTLALGAISAFALAGPDEIPQVEIRSPMNFRK